MKHSRRWKLIVGLGIVVASIAGAVLWNPLRASYAERRILLQTSKLPDCDRVVVYALRGQEYSNIEESRVAQDVRLAIGPNEDIVSTILQQGEFVGDEAAEICALWRSQVFGWEYQALCHAPVLGFQFYRGEKLVFDTSLCFHCSNFLVTVSGETGWWGLDKSRSQAQALYDYFQVRFPDHLEPAVIKDA